MTDCGRASNLILAVVRQKASEAERLLLDEHLARCSRCREARAQWSLMETLRDQPDAHLGTEARGRVLRHLQQLPAGGVAPAPRFVGGTRFALIGAAVLVLAGGLLAARGGPSHTPGAPEPVLLQAERAGESGLFPGVHLAYEAGTTLRFPEHVAGHHPRARQEDRVVELLAGKLDVDVTPGGPGHFRVQTKMFVVEVLGTRFSVSLDEVRTVHGTVRVLDPSGRVLAVLLAGESWRRPSQPSAAVAPIMPAAPVTTALPLPLPLPVASASRQVPVASRQSIGGEASRHVGQNAGHFLAEARTLLGQGETARARSKLAEALAARPLKRERAMAELLQGDAFLVEGRPELALPAYQKTARIFAGTAEAETAEFAAAEILFERGAAAEAREAFAHYLARHPTGRFAREARERAAVSAKP